MEGDKKSGSLMPVPEESCCDLIHISYENCLEKYCGIFKLDESSDHYVNTFDDHIIMIKDELSKVTY